MSRYTLRLCDVCECLYQGNDNALKSEYTDITLTELVNPFINLPSVDEIITNVRTKIFDFDYPLPNNSESKKKELETKILKHYYMRELGFDSWGRFKLALNDRLNMIMPYFNDLYKSVEMNLTNPLVNNEITEKRTITGENSSKGKETNIGTSTTTNQSTNTNVTESTSNDKKIFEDTPTSSLGNTDYATNITTDNNASTTNENANGTSSDTTNGSTTSNSENTGSNSEIMDRTLSGLSSFSKQDMIAKYRENIINVDEAIVLELYDLFLLIYD